MNEAMVFADGFKKSFAQEGSLLDFLKNREEKTEWKKENANRLRFEAVSEGSPRMNELYDEYAKIGKAEVIKDTMDNTQLFLRTETECIPVRTCAIKTILERAKISGTALSKVERPIFARILNHCLNVADGQALLKVSDDKVSAVHGGDKSDYSVLEMHELFTRTHDYLNDNFTKVSYVGGFFEHTMVTAVWSLDESEELVEAYKDLLSMHGVSHKDIKPSLNDFTYRYVERDYDFEDQIIEAEEYFWEEYVTKRIEPPFVEKPDMALKCLASFIGGADTDASRLTIPNKYLPALEKYVTLKEQKSKIDAESKKLEEEIKRTYLPIVEELGVVCEGELTSPGKRYYIYYKPRKSTKINKENLEKLAACHKDIFDEYVTTSESRTFNVKEMIVK